MKKDTIRHLDIFEAAGIDITAPPLWLDKLTEYSIRSISALSRSLVVLDRADLLTQNDIQALFGSEQDNLKAFSRVIKRANQKNLLNRQLLDVLLNHVALWGELDEAYEAIYQNGLLNADRQETILTHITDAIYLSNIWVWLNEANMLTNENFSAVMQYPRYLAGIGYSLYELVDACQFNLERFRKILINAEYSKTVSYAFQAMKEANRLERIHVDAIFFQPKLAIWYAYSNQGNASQNPGAKDYMRIRLVSRLLYQMQLPLLISIKIASFSGENHALDRKICKSAAWSVFFTPTAMIDSRLKKLKLEGGDLDSVPERTYYRA